MNTQVSSTFGNYNKLRKRKRVRLYKYLSPVKPEIKQWNCISGSLVVDSKYDAKTIMNICQPTQGTSASGSWELVPFRWPSSGYGSDDMIGNHMALKWVLLRGYATVSASIAYKCNYKLVLIKTQNNYTDMHQFLDENFLNYQFPATWEGGPHVFNSMAERREYARHNYYKLVKNVTNQSEFKTSIRVLAAGTFTPEAGNPAPRLITTTGSNPAISYDTTSLGDSEINQFSYYPLNVKLTCNDNIDVTLDHYYLALLTDQPVGHRTGAFGSETVVAAAYFAFSFNFFTLGYYIDS